MALDGLTLSALIDELRPVLINTRVDQVFQPGREELALVLRGARETLTLILSADARLARLHLGERPPGPATPPPFCMVLRKHLGSSRLMAVRQEGLDRVIVLDFEAYDEFTGVAKKHLHLELMGKHSNIILSGPDGVILDAIKHVTEQQSRHREILPGIPLIPPPPQPKEDMRRMNMQDLEIMLHRSDPTTPAADVLVRRLAGVGPVLAAELLHRASLAGRTAGSFQPEDIQRLWGELGSLARQSMDGSWSPAAVIDRASGRVVEFSCITLSHLEPSGAVTPGPLNQWVRRAFESKAEAQRIAGTKNHLTRIAAQALERAEKRLKIHQASLDESDQYEKWRQYGELLQGAPAPATKGKDVLTVPNYFDADCAPVSIPVDPALDVRENAQRYFKKYGKAKRGVLAATGQLSAAREEADYFESVLAELEQAVSPRDIEEIRLELEAAGCLKPSGGRRPAAKPSLPLRFVSSEGLDILVGRNNLQNDRLTTQTASPNDLWIHVQKIPGSHVIVRRNGTDGPDDRTLWEAANLAVHFSRARGSSKVPVDQTLRKHVRKPPGSRPGAVLYDHFRTIIVDPDPEVLKRFGLGDEGCHSQDHHGNTETRRLQKKG